MKELLSKNLNTFSRPWKIANSIETMKWLSKDSYSDSSNVITHLITSSLETSEYKLRKDSLMIPMNRERDKTLSIFSKN